MNQLDQEVYKIIKASFIYSLDIGKMRSIVEITDLVNKELLNKKIYFKYTPKGIGMFIRRKFKLDIKRMGHRNISYPILISMPDFIS